MQPYRNFESIPAKPTNSAAISAFRYHVIILWHRRLRRLSQRTGLVWTQMAKLADEFLAKPRIPSPTAKSLLLAPAGTASNVNPLTLHGQAIGGLVQGLGGAFLGHLVYDANGQLLAGNLADYLIPTATDYPKIRAIALENYRSPSNPLGVKGTGEGAIIPIGGLMANAVANALTSFGAMPNQLPLSPAGVWHMGSAKQSTRGSG
jgi:hypothetical protein